MKNLRILFLLLISIALSAQNTKTETELKTQAPDYSTQVASIDSIVKTLYSVVSGAKGEKRNWDLFKQLFRKNARLIPTGKNNENKIMARYLTADSYIETSGEWLVENGFYEVEINRKVDIFGNIAHVFSTYESFKSKSDTEPFMRGINSIQLLNDGERWWIVNIYWMQESEEYPIPPDYLPKQ
jgi:hypothetical protein